MGCIESGRYMRFVQVVLPYLAVQHGGPADTCMIHLSYCILPWLLMEFRPFRIQNNISIVFQYNINIVSFKVARPPNMTLFTSYVLFSSSLHPFIFSSPHMLLSFPSPSFLLHHLPSSVSPSFIRNPLLLWWSPAAMSDYFSYWSPALSVAPYTPTPWLFPTKTNHHILFTALFP